MKIYFSARGQTLVLLSMTVLIITLMVLMTLSLGAKVRDRMDLQTVADTSAYSNAIATARTMNAIALMNRAMIAHTVSTIGTLSLLSYCTLFYADAKAAQELFTEQLIILTVGFFFWLMVWMMDSPPQKPPDMARWKACLQSMILVGISLLLMSMLVSGLSSALGQDSQLYNGDTYPRWLASNYLFSAGVNMLQTGLASKLTSDTTSFASQYLASAKVANGLNLVQSANMAAAPLNQAEMQRAMLPNNDWAGDQPYQMGMMTMGSRGGTWGGAEPFVSHRKLHVSDWSWKLTLPWSLPNGTLVDDDGGGGRGYVNSGLTDDPTSGPPYGHPGPGGYESGVTGLWAHDKGNTVRTILVGSIIGVAVTANSSDYFTCTIFGPIAIAIGLFGKRASNVDVGASIHDPIHGPIHAFPTQTFPSFIDYAQPSLFNPEDLQGQPRTVTMVAKQAPPTYANAMHSDPWNVSTAFVPGNGSNLNARFDMNGEPQLATGSNLQLAVGSGVTYYSRPGHNNEPPNMFAPYWHATLGRLTIDRPSPGNAMRAAYDAEVLNMLLNTGQMEAAAAYQGLSIAGYKGLE
jgi:hypothetical protein